ncbi:MAG: Vacuolar H+transporting two-sector ATPase F subunit [Gammaproteobacteria bacterium]|nr:Vacuolar H+transporting two-sector ATPase F subunit [Gammaproteobacteria bacterium]
MVDILFIGDEISACGFRLAGVDILVPELGDEAHVFDSMDKKNYEDNDLIIVTAEIAAAVPQHSMERLMLMDKPLLMVLSDMRDQTLAPDLSVILRHQLGMAD